MANQEGHRRFGNIRKRESGRYQARYPGPDGRMRSAPQTFARKPEAEKYLLLVEAQMMRGEWIDPERGKIRLRDYAERWIAERPNLRPRTVHLYRWTLSRHITPHLGDMPLNRIDTPMVREWRAQLLAEGVSVTMAAKAYRLLRAVLMTAVKEDELIRANPCRVVGADQEKPAERPVLTVPQIFALAEQMPERFRALILITTFGCLRWGEVVALQRCDVDLSAGTVQVRQAFVEHRGTGLILGPPKSRAGARTVALPKVALPVLKQHMSSHVGEAPEAFVFTGESGRNLWRGNFNKLVKWPEAVTAVGVPGLHFHDLRHTGNTLASRAPGASLRDIMARMGHDSPRAALIYQHANREADQGIADAIDQAVKAARRKPSKRKVKRVAEGDGPATEAS
ncbi:tyrosine-type recombinase/integrase [Salinispora arenicola]|uniref:tyrosine-type recombinase/integrase n=1 Tax=Salinispora arenicola TaxID=168697 RepID=UPI0016B5C996|nr:tyrosine-type recombinase/integrase [Salinispora arenicola]NIL59163.1 site-specific integrase [Salinispora arenicola]NIL63734.1 site-specific integrase [Salinispora arenicola]